MSEPEKKHSKIKISGKIIGEGEPTYIIAEAGVNHNGELELAKKLIDTAKIAGADAVKFQTFRTEKLVTKTARTALYQERNTGTESQHTLLKNLELHEDEIRELVKHAEKREITFLSTPFDEESCQLLAELGIPAYKISSGDLTNTPLLEEAASGNIPIILSTGMATIPEIREALMVLEEHESRILLMHCVTQYPAPVETLNLRAIETLKRTFNLPTGFSDHSTSVHMAPVAVALGADLIEKHFTLDRSLPGPDHRASLNPEELSEMISGIRDTERALGDGVKTPTPGEEKIKTLVRRSIVAARDIREGEVIQRDMITFKRPAIGIKPGEYRKLIGKHVKKPLRKDQHIRWEDVEWKEE